MRGLRVIDRNIFDDVSVVSCEELYYESKGINIGKSLNRNEGAANFSR
jgi:hypothetical protein